MKVVKPGVPPPPPPTWWEDHYAACSTCGTIVLLEKGDPITVHGIDNGVASIICPMQGCRHLINITRQEAVEQATNAAANEGRKFIDQNV